MQIGHGCQQASRIGKHPVPSCMLREDECKTTHFPLTIPLWQEQSTDRPLCALLLPKGNGQREVRRLTFVFPEHAGWNWVLPDARSLLATVTYLHQTLENGIAS